MSLNSSSCLLGLFKRHLGSELDSEAEEEDKELVLSRLS